MPADVAATFDASDREVRDALLSLRHLILDTAAETADVGPLEESLKWGQPSYRPLDGGGTTVRVAPVRGSSTTYGMYVTCSTSLVEQWRDAFGELFRYDGTRGILFEVGAPVPTDEVRACVVMALTYHRTD